MKENEFKPIAKTILEDLGLEVTDIPRKNLKTPDFDVKGKNSRYTIELKIKGDDPKEKKKESEVLGRGEIVAREVPVGRRNRLYGIVKEGIQQIEEYDPQHNTFHVIWLHSAGRDAYLHNMRFHASLFGTQDLFSIRKKGLITCYYFHESIFYSYCNNIDGAILTYHDKGQLCVNTLSSRLKNFRNSDLYKSLVKGLCDPETMQNREGIMIADCDFDRKEPNKIINYLCEKYHLEHLQTIDMKQYSAMVALPNLEKGKK
jgi:hypothetical protein